VGAAVLAAPLLLWLIKAAGIAYLLWMAWRLSHSAQMASLQSERQLQVGFWQGVGLQFVNIKAWLLALAIVAGWIAGREDLSARMSVVLPVMAAYAFFSNLLYACVGALLRHWLAQGRRLLWFNRAMAALLALTALWMVAA
jgi:threonine/homoserine/homoserine lactone efflux protein